MFYPSAPCTLDKIMRIVQNPQIEQRNYIIDVINDNVASVCPKTADSYPETLSN